MNKEDEVDANPATKEAAERKARLAEDKAMFNLTGGRVVSVEAFAGELYTVYADSVGWDKTGATHMLAWSDLANAPEGVRAHWRAVARAVARILSS